jgi:cell division initiation protein
MAYTPVELRHVRLPRRPFGYRRSTTDRLFAEVADSFEEVWRERGDLADKVEQLENDLVRYRELEALLRTTLVSAERASQEVRGQAKREAELILSEAHAEARTVTRRAAAERERLLAHTHVVRSRLEAALDTLDEGEEDKPEATVEAA